ncbi:molybdopterin-guanine dinucleotide biosynthesis protein [Arcanobacterium phocisimile]|uniref:Molybdopterin-guanine dinucleotide biosynthesis protein n=1 Tax=Arcanobacterium phocisimile TaxID=1302235 RepID=A0ABX7IF04_9ACTO|nr:DUF6457 domain-containing protein [Arcanobacterium phocisimile]QRV01716.1 molybdopterin-guanine dinucleotide biosynthesis protein [Arcanobacterium phocisimile]
MTRKDDPLAMKKMDAWLNEVNSLLGLEPTLIATYQKPLLELISTIAHGPSRPGAPLTAFLLGYASAQSNEDPAKLASKLEDLAANFSFSE